MFYHGTTARLEVGDILVPGNSIGVSYYGRSDHVYMTSTDGYTMSSVEYAPAWVRSTQQFGLYSAIRWASYAADICCEKQCVFTHVATVDHFDAFCNGNFPDCFSVYEVEPLGKLEFDDASDCDGEGVRTTHAKVIRCLSIDDILNALDVDVLTLV